MNFKDVLNRLGTLRNELLVFAVLIAVILNGSAFGLESGSGKEGYQKIGGFIMHISTIPILLLFGAFYCYAFLHLPSSAQELIFTMHAKEIVSDDGHQRAESDPKSQ
jgi:hypothetical protein